MTSWHPNRGDDSPTTTSAILGVDKQDMIMPKQRRNWGLIIAIIVSGVLLGGIGAAGVSIYQHVTNTTTAPARVAASAAPRRRAGVVWVGGRWCTMSYYEFILILVLVTGYIVAVKKK